MSKKAKTFIFIVAMIVIIILCWIGIRAFDKRDEYDSSLCTICHQNKRIANATYCYSCYQKAQQRVEEKEKQKENATVDSKKPANSSDTKPLDKVQEADPKKPANSSDTGTGSSSGKTSSSSSSCKTTSSSSSTNEEYNSLNYDPEDYDNPDEYADDAWDEDFDSYDEAYEYWEDY